eukprot:2533003-Rhodomonas_salina.2
MVGFTRTSGMDSLSLLRSTGMVKTFALAGGALPILDPDDFGVLIAKPALFLLASCYGNYQSRTGC